MPHLTLHTRKRSWVNDLVFAIQCRAWDVDLRKETSVFARLPSIEQITITLPSADACIKDPLARKHNKISLPVTWSRPPTARVCAREEHRPFRFVSFTLKNVLCFVRSATMHDCSWTGQYKHDLLPLNGALSGEAVLIASSSTVKEIRRCADVMSTSA